MRSTRLLTCVRRLRSPQTAGLTFEVISGDTSVADAVAALIRR